VVTVRPWADPDEGLGELLSLWSAESADDLHRVLVLHPHVRESADAFEPMALLSKHHATEPETSAETAVLLLTDRRWRGGVRHLVDRIAESGLLTGDQLDLLAMTFLAADHCVYWEVPKDWFSEESVVIVLSDEEGVDADEVAEDVNPAVAAREVAPTLRRWAAARLLAREPASWPRLLARAEDLDARQAAAVVAGMFDSIGSMPTAAQALLVTKGTTWPHQSVRRAALEFVAARDGAQVASQLARVDPNAKIRAWAATLDRPRTGPGQPEVRESEPDPGLPPGEVGQPTLF
jgi:hypothetical protein